VILPSHPLFCAVMPNEPVSFVYGDRNITGNNLTNVGHRTYVTNVGRVEVHSGKHVSYFSVYCPLLITCRRKANTAIKGCIRRTPQFSGAIPSTEVPS